MDPFLAVAASDLLSPWPLWLAGLVAGLALIFVGRPSSTRRIFGIGLIALMPLTAYSFAVWTDNSCFEGYAYSTECDLSIAWLFTGIALLAGIGLTTALGLYRLVRIAARLRGPAPHGS